MRKDFCIFILTHGRPDRVITFNSLKRSGYTGKIYLVIDNEDDSASKYYKNYGKENVLLFDKKAISLTFDTADNFDDRRSIVYARNACFSLAQELGIKYFMQLDDDYTEFQYRFDRLFFYNYRLIHNLDNIISMFLKFLTTTNIKSISMAQGGDFIGGSSGTFAKNICLKRKCMNTFICKTENPINFIGAINEDVNTYTRLASTGDLFFTFNGVSIVQKQTQNNPSGMTDIYLDGGTYKKSFYTVMYHPSSVKIALMGPISKRIHHRISWNNTVPKILREAVKNGQT